MITKHLITHNGVYTCMFKTPELDPTELIENHTCVFETVEGEDYEAVEAKLWECAKDLRADLRDGMDEDERFFVEKQSGAWSSMAYRTQAQDVPLARSYVKEDEKGNPIVRIDVWFGNELHKLTEDGWIYVNFYKEEPENFGTAEENNLTDEMEIEGFYDPDKTDKIYCLWTDSNDIIHPIVAKESELVTHIGRNMFRAIHQNGKQFKYSMEAYFERLGNSRRRDAFFLELGLQEGLA